MFASDERVGGVRRDQQVKSKLPESRYVSETCVPGQLTSANPGTGRRTEGIEAEEEEGMEISRSHPERASTQVMSASCSGGVRKGGPLRDESPNHGWTRIGQLGLKQNAEMQSTQANFNLSGRPLPLFDISDRMGQVDVWSPCVPFLASCSQNDIVSG